MTFVCWGGCFDQFETSISSIFEKFDVLTIVKCTVFFGILALQPLTILNMLDRSSAFLQFSLQDQGN